MFNLQWKSGSAVREAFSALCLLIAARGALLGVAQTGAVAQGLEQVKTQSTAYYCRVNALNKAEWARLHTLALDVSWARVEWKELPEGYAFRLRSDQIRLQDLGE